MATEDSDSATDPIAVDPKAKAKAGRALPTERIVMPKQLQLLRAWGHAYNHGGQQPVQLKEAASVAGFADSTASLANGFFQENGFLRREARGFVPAREIADFARAYEWNPDAAASRLAPLIEPTWFGRAVLPKIRFKPARQADVLGWLAEEAGARKDHEGQLLAVLDLMRLVGLVEVDGGFVRKGSTPAAGNDAPDETFEPRAEDRPGVPMHNAYAVPVAQADIGRIQMTFAVNVSMADMAGWSKDQIEAFFKGVAAVLSAQQGGAKT